MLIEEQIHERRERAKKAVSRVVARPARSPFGDYEIESSSGRGYRVAMRGPGLFDNYCTCPDFAVNTLGTCKHIEAILSELREQHGSGLDRRKFRRRRASISLVYGETLGVRLALPDNPSAELKAIAAEFSGSGGMLNPAEYRRFGELLDRLREADDAAVIYSDALDFVERENELAENLDFEKKTLAGMAKGREPLKGLLKVPLYAYQQRGALFAACRGRVVLADDMGLGKTIQTIGAIELLRRRRGIERVLVIAPASVKFQWKTEIEKFCDLTAQVIHGGTLARRKQYAEPTFFNLTSYELVRHDMDSIRDLKPDAIVLDEAQRIRNWTTATARIVKQLKSRYAIVLTGTPLENKIEELYSVVEFVDGRRLGPAFRFLAEHRMEDENGKLTGYRGLGQIRRQLAPILLRRTRAEVLKDLPPRTDQVFRVPMTREQAIPYGEQRDSLGRLMKKWERQGWLSEVDQKRVMMCLQSMRMLCNSTFLFDQESNFSPKLDEFREIVRELALEEGRKVVVFSEYERMTRIAGEVLDELKIGFVSLHGGVPGSKRGKLMERFRTDPKCMVFLSTDAGGVGLNLQSASAVINFEPPWNPARLEQRIARVHRLGQTQPVQVIHLLTQGSIEERVWETMRLKRALFAGVFDGASDTVDFSKLGRRRMMEELKDLLAQTEPEVPEPPVAEPEPPPPARAPDPMAIGISLLRSGLEFVESLAKRQVDVEAIRSGVRSMVKADSATGRPVLHVPLPEGIDAEAMLDSIGGIFAALGKALRKPE